MDKKVFLYSLSTCGHCKATKVFLDSRKVCYDFKDVDLLDLDARKCAVEEIKKINPSCSFPTLLIGDKVIIGFKEEAIRKALGDD